MITTADIALGLSWYKGEGRSMKVAFIRVVCFYVWLVGNRHLSDYQKLNPCRFSKDSRYHALWINSSTLAVFVTPPYSARARVLISSSDLEMLLIRIKSYYTAIAS